MEKQYPVQSSYACDAHKLYQFQLFYKKFLPEGVKPRLGYVYVPCYGGVWKALSIVIATNRSEEDRELGRNAGPIIEQIQETFATTNAAGWYYIGSYGKF